MHIYYIYIYIYRYLRAVGVLLWDSNLHKLGYGAPTTILNCNQQNLVELQPLFGGVQMVIKRQKYGDLMGYIYIYWDILEIK